MDDELFRPVIRELEAFEAGSRIIEDIIVIDAWMKIADLHRCPEESHTNFDGNGVVGVAVKHELGMLDATLDAILSFHRDDETFFRICPTKVIVVG